MGEVGRGAGLLHFFSAGVRDEIWGGHCAQAGAGSALGRTGGFAVLSLSWD